MKKSIELADCILSYYELGTGEPHIIVHGNRDCKENLLDLALRLSTTYGGKYYVIDLRGFGESSKFNGDYTIDLFVDDIENFCLIKKLDKVTYIGHSLGSTIGLRFAYKNPDLISKLVLMSGAGSFSIGFRRPTFSRENFLDQLKQTNQLAAKFFFQSGYNEVKENIMSNWLKVDYDVHTKLIEMKHPDLRNEASKIKAITLLLYGNKDRATPTEKGEELNNLIPNSKLSIIDGGAHYMYLEKPVATCKEIGEFLHEKK